MSTMKRITIGLVAHVDAGKTTLSESLLYQTGSIKVRGNVNDGNTIMDFDETEKRRGITIYSGQAELQYQDTCITLLDTPGHMDFCAETERTLSVLDAAVLVISGLDGVQAHSETLWKLLEHYHIPVMVFVSKMDIAKRDKEELMGNIQSSFGRRVIQLNEKNALEEISLESEKTMEEYLETETLCNESISELWRTRKFFPCYFGSGVSGEGIQDLLDFLNIVSTEKIKTPKFQARVFKISHDHQGNRLTHLKITSGELKTRDTVHYQGIDEKITMIRVYNGEKYRQIDSASVGMVCEVIGLTATKAGEVLGESGIEQNPVVQPVMRYNIILPENTDAKRFYQQLQIMKEEDPLLCLSWNEKEKAITVALMGEIQAQILREQIEKRFQVKIEFGKGTILYKETINNTVEGVGHYEPLRHYAEVHLILSPLPRGTGIQIGTDCKEDVLDLNWQRLVLTHLAEKMHLGVLTGSPITDISIRLASGRAHLKHTEGGDFRQATYRAVRQGLMQAKSELLEPVYQYELVVPNENIGRAISDIQLRGGTYKTKNETKEMSVISGKVPVSEMQDYYSELASYTHGKGKLLLQPAGYEKCHNAEQVIEIFEYNPLSDLENSPDSIFCENGAGYQVPWYEVPLKMHLEMTLKKKAKTFDRNLVAISDEEMRKIISRAIGPEKNALERYPTTGKPKVQDFRFQAKIRPKTLIVDGYNVIFSNNELKEEAKSSLEIARGILIHYLDNYSAYTKTKIYLIFDAYKVRGNKGKQENSKLIEIIYTKENETADMYIEKLIQKICKEENCRVVTNDNIIRVSTARAGILRMSVQELENELANAQHEITELLNQMRAKKGTTIGEISEI